MASVTKRGKRWRVQIRKRGHNVSESFATKALAQQWANKKELEIEEGRLTNNRAGDKTLSMIFDDYSQKVSIHKPGCAWEQKRLKWFQQSFLADMRVVDIETPDIVRFRDERLMEVSGSTVNRDLNLLSHVFTICVDEWKYIDENPCKRIRRPRENPHRDRRITNAEIKKIRKVLDYPEDTVPTNQKQLVANLWLTSIETAMRLGEANAVNTSNFYAEEQYVQLDKTKNGERRKVALNKRAVELIKLKLKSNYHDIPHNLSKCFENYSEKSGIKDLNYHDSRHEAITRLASKIHVLALSRTTGIKDMKRLMTYYNESATDIAKELD